MLRYLMFNWNHRIHIWAVYYLLLHLVYYPCCDRVALAGGVGQVRIGSWRGFRGLEFGLSCTQNQLHPEFGLLHPTWVEEKIMNADGGGYTRGGRGHRVSGGETAQRIQTTEPNTGNIFSPCWQNSAFRSLTTSAALWRMLVPFLVITASYRGKYNYDIWPKVFLQYIFDITVTQSCLNFNPRYLFSVRLIILSCCCASGLGGYCSDPSITILFFFYVLMTVTIDWRKSLNCHSLSRKCITCIVTQIRSITWLPSHPAKTNPVPNTCPS